MTELRIIMADDHPIIREGTRSILGSRPEWVIVAEATDGRQAVEKSAQLKSEVVVLDLSLPDMSGLEAACRIRAFAPETEFVVLTVLESESTMYEAFSCGVLAYVLKSEAGDHLIDAIEAVSRHQMFVTPNTARRLSGEASNPDASQLTPREAEVLCLLAEGCANKQVADRLNISPKTAETHRSNLMRKIGAHGLADVVRYAISNNLIKP